MNSRKAKFLVYATILSTMLYLIWRSFYTLPIGYGILSMCFGIILLAAEITGMFEQIVHFYSMKDIEVPELPEVGDATYPSVDVFIATYNEPVELLFKTVNGCVNMKYPEKEKVKIFLCDDGGREEVRKLAEHFGIGYFAREDHKGAKAGNLNYALEHTNGELVATFDADMIPMSDFLMATVPYFIAKDKIGFIQTPQNFYNFDLFQYNLYSEDMIPNEQDYFYRDIQLAKNKTNSVIYGGSNTVIARAALEEVGGFVTSVITEDFATGMLIQSKGYSCYAIDGVHASGLSPEDITSLIKQRRRWARGCIQTGRKLHIMSQKGLNIKQKISYINAISYWYSSFKRLIYMISPILFSVFGIRVLIATPLSLFIFWLPMYLLNANTLKYLSGNIRTRRWTNIYETIMFPVLLKDVFLECLGVSDTVFAVTRKGGPGEASERQLKYAVPHIILILFTGIGILNCVRLMFETGNVSSMFLLFWLVLNIYSLIMAVLFMSGRKVLRKHKRFHIDAAVTISYEHATFNTRVKDISEGGFSAILETPEYLPPDEAAAVTISADGYVMKGHAKIVHVRKAKEGYRYAFCFEEFEEVEYRNLLYILHDRVPPLTRVIQKDYGFFEDLRMNIINRYRKMENYSRKLPRVHLESVVVTTKGIPVTVLSFNYEYVAIKVDQEQGQEPMSFEIQKNHAIELMYVKPLPYYEMSKIEKQTKVVNLYRILNVDEMLKMGEVSRILHSFQKRYERQARLEKLREYKMQSEVEYNEMEWL